VALKWVEEKRGTLLSSANTIMSQVLSNHMCSRSSPEAAQRWAQRWVDGIIFHMTSDGFNFQEKIPTRKRSLENVHEAIPPPPRKKLRGRPRKVAHNIQLTEELFEDVRTRSQTRNSKGGTSHFERLFQGKPLTTSPTKIDKKVRFLVYFDNPLIEFF
jgi:hypothetical protein